MRNKLWQRMVAAFLTLAMAFTVLPLQALAAGSGTTTVNVAANDFQRLERTTNNTTIASNYYTGGTFVQFNALVTGERAFLQFSMPYNGEMSAKIYRTDHLQEDFGEEFSPDDAIADAAREENFVGYVAGTVYTSHVSASGGSHTSGTQFVREQTMASIRAALKKLPLAHKSLEAFYGYGLTGKSPAYRTLAEYYAFYGLDDPAAVAAQEQADAACTGVFFCRRLPYGQETLPALVSILKRCRCESGIASPAIAAIPPPTRMR